MRALLACGLFVALSYAAWAQSQAAPAFEVASVRVNSSGNGHHSVERDTGRITMTNVDLKSAIALAYGVTESQVSGPGWLDSERYDVIAKAPEGAKEDEQPAMLQTLLADRFKLRAHRETRETSVYAIVVAKNGPKFQPVEGGANDGGVSSSAGHMTAHKIPMARLATFLGSARAQLDRPVVDMTGLQGVFDLNLVWEPDRPERAKNDGESGPSLFTALQEQLGLKLESRKAPVEILVVDAVEKTPTEN